jgi:hypothetical protein
MAEKVNITGQKKFRKVNFCRGLEIGKSVQLYYYSIFFYKTGPEKAGLGSFACREMNFSRVKIESWKPKFVFNLVL